MPGPVGDTQQHTQVDEYAKKQPGVEEQGLEQQAEQAGTHTATGTTQSASMATTRAVRRNPMPAATAKVVESVRAVVWGTEALGSSRASTCTG